MAEAALARDRARLAGIRQQLDRQRATSALFDSAGHARDLETLYERMAARHAQGLPPEHLPAPGPARTAA